jgi:hypothetical protein
MQLGILADEISARLVVSVGSTDGLASWVPRSRCHWERGIGGFGHSEMNFRASLTRVQHNGQVQHKGQVRLKGQVNDTQIWVCPTLVRRAPGEAGWDA